MDSAAIKKTHELKESVVLETRWSNRFRSLGIGIDYFWDPAKGSIDKDRPRRLVVIQLTGCLWVNFRQPTAFAETDLHYPESPLTIRAWDIDLDVPDGLPSAEGYRYAFLVTETSAPHKWLEAVYRDVEIHRLS